MTRHQQITTSYSCTRRINERQTVPHILPGTLLAARGEPVLATGSMIAMLEDATWELLAPDVPDELAILGCGGVYEHTAPTLPGQVVRIEVDRGPVHADGRQTWTVRAINADTGQQAGVLHHRVATIERARFWRRLHRQDGG